MECIPIQSSLKFSFSTTPIINWMLVGLVGTAQILVQDFTESSVLSFSKMPVNRPKESFKITSLQEMDSDSELESMIKIIGAEKLIVLYFFLPWCGSCQKITSAVEAMADKYQQHAVFLRVNAERLPVATKKNSVVRVPLFVLLNNRVKVDRIEGASPHELESKVRRNINDIQFQRAGVIPPSTLVPQPIKMQDLTPYLNKAQCRCINDLIPTPFQAFLEGKKLVSGKGLGRVILVYAFKEKMVITALKIKAPVYSGPKVLRFFVNLHKVLDFAVVSQMSSTQEVILAEEELTGDHAIDLKSGGLVGIETLQIYIPENMTKNRKTEIDFLTLIGAPMSTTNYANIDSSAIATSSTHHPTARVHERKEETDDYEYTNVEAGPSGRRRSTDYY